MEYPIIDTIKKQQSENDIMSIVPFGKYKGQPVTVLAGDPNYCEWLRSQEGIRQKYPSIINLIVNNFSIPQDTPEHNALQARFVDDEDFLKKLISLLLESSIKEAEWYHFCRTEFRCEKCNVLERCADMLPLDQMQSFQNNYIKNSKIEIDARCFEQQGWDVVLTGRFLGKKTFSTEVPCEREYCDQTEFCSVFGNNFGFAYGLEIKPQIGDDYPAVIREITARNTARNLRSGGYDYVEPVLLYKTFCGTGVTETQMRKMMSSCAKVFTFDEIDQSEPIESLFTFE